MADYARLKTWFNSCCLLTACENNQGELFTWARLPEIQLREKWFPGTKMSLYAENTKVYKDWNETDGYLIGLSGRHIWSQFEAELGFSASPFLLFSSAMIRTCCWPCTKTSFMHGVSDEEYIKNDVKMSKFNSMKQNKNKFSSCRVLFYHRLREIG